MQEIVGTGIENLATNINNFRKPKSQLIVESRDDCAKTYLEEMIIEMEL